MHARDPGRIRGRARRPERRGQDHAAAHVGRPDRADRPARSRCSAASPPGRRPRWTGSRSWPRTRRCTRTCPSADMLHLTRNLNRRWDQQRAETRLAELGIPLTAEGRQAVRRPAGAARADPRPGPAAPAAGPRRAAGQPRPAGPARLHGLAHGGGGRGRAVGGAVLARDRRAGAGGRLPDRAVPRPGAGGRRGRATCSPATAC